MPRVVVHCDCCPTTKVYMGSTWEEVGKQVAGDFVWPLCRVCFNLYERSLVETAQVKPQVITVREYVMRWV